MTAERILVAGDRSIPYSVIRSDRRTMAVCVSPKGAVCVRAPRWLPEREVTRFVRARTGWIVRKHVEAAERAAMSPGPLTPDELAHARRVFPERVAVCWAVFAGPGEAMPGLRVRAMRTRWGSLAPSGRITLNAALVRASAECLDYVIFHELCHLRIRGHGRDFWEHVARYVPDWKTRRRELREHAL